LVCTIFRTKYQKLGFKDRWIAFKETGLFRVIRNKYFIVAAIFIIWITFFDANNLINLFKVARHIGEQKTQKEYYEELIKSTDEKLNELSSNRDSLEKYAREQYLFKESDEEVFIVEGKK